MSLIKCPECGKEISDKAPRCPNCGYEASKRKKTKIIVFAGILSGITLFFLCFVLVIIILLNHKTPMEKMVQNSYKELKKIEGPFISLETASVYKYTTSEGEEKYDILLVYEKNNTEMYAAFNNDGRFLGDGNTHNSSMGYSEKNAQALLDDFNVISMKMALINYFLGIDDSEYSENFVTEKEAVKYDECAVLISVKKIK